VGEIACSIMIYASTFFVSVYMIFFSFFSSPAITVLLVAMWGVTGV